MEKLSRKEKEFLTRRGYILDAAREVFSQKGFAETTIEEIAEKAEFGKGTLYNYFPSKQELFITLIEEGVEGLLVIASEVAAMDVSPLEKIKLLLQKELEHFQHNAGLFRIVHFEMKCLELKRICGKIENVREITETIFAQGVKEGVFKKINPVQLRVLYSGFVHGYVFLYWSAYKHHEPLTNEETSEMLDCFLDGVIKRD